MLICVEVCLDLCWYVLKYVLICVDIPLICVNVCVDICWCMCWLICVNVSICVYLYHVLLYVLMHVLTNTVELEITQTTITRNLCKSFKVDENFCNSKFALLKEFDQPLPDNSGSTVPYLIYLTPSSFVTPLPN